MTKALRINFELDRADNPPLYDELMQFPKGVKRVSRLRTLAYAGLLSQSRHDSSPLYEGQLSPIDGSPSSPGEVAASLELFGPSADA